MTTGKDLWQPGETGIFNAKIMDTELTIIRGERNVATYCRHKWGETPRFCESFAHVGWMTVELLYEKSPTDDGYAPYYLLYERNSCFTTEMRHEAHKAIIEGRWEQYKAKTTKRQ